MKNVSARTFAGWMPKRPEDSHKGTYGHVLILAGSKGMMGAALLCARAAVRSGCGLTTLAVPESQQAVAAAALPEVMTLGLSETASGSVRGDAVGRLQSAHRKKGFTVLALGPGLGTHSETARAVVGALGSISLPAVIDADALNILSQNSRAEVQRLFKRRHVPVVITPHPGEAGRLLGTSSQGVCANRRKAALALAQETGGVCLLKGRQTLVTDAKRLYLNKTGNAGLAKGGSGDVLTGVIASLWAQRLKAASSDAEREKTGFEAAALGAYLHGGAADWAIKEKTRRCLMATDLVEALPYAFKKISA